MKKALLADTPPSRQLLFSVFLMICLWIIFQIAAMTAGMVIFGLNINEAANSMETLGNPSTINFLKFVQLFSSIGMFIVSSFAAAWFIDNEPISFLGLRKQPKLRFTLAGIALFILVIPFNNSLSYFNESIHLPGFLDWMDTYFREKETQMGDIMEAFLKPGSAGGLIYNLLVVAIVPGIGEELIFRGLIQRLFGRWFRNHHFAIVVTSFLFAAIHFQFLSFLPRLLLGLILGYIFYWSRSIWLVILLHFLNNTAAVVFYYYFHGGSAESYVENAGTPGNNLWLALISAAGCAVLLNYMYRNYLKEKSAI
jgi:uncharacterized protein